MPQPGGKSPRVEVRLKWGVRPRGRRRGWGGGGRHPRQSCADPRTTPDPWPRRGGGPRGRILRGPMSSNRSGTSPALGGPDPSRARLAATGGGGGGPRPTDPLPPAGPPQPTTVPLRLGGCSPAWRRRLAPPPPEAGMQPRRSASNAPGRPAAPRTSSCFAMAHGESGTRYEVCPWWNGRGRKWWANLAQTLRSLP